MANIAPQPSSAKDVNTQASIWLERVHAGNWTGDDQRELDGWLAQSHLHRAAFWRLEAAWSDASRLAALGPARFRKVVANRKFLAATLKFVVAAAAAVVLSVVGTRYAMKPPIETYHTTIGGRELVRFSDGTEIELNTDTILRASMTTRERTVWLDQGEAFFHVTHDAAHPFTVFVGNKRVTDLGTEFVVQRDAAQTQVAVLKGRVRFDAPDVQTLVRSAALQPGDVATASLASMSIAKETSQDLVNLVSWRRGVLVFRHTALGDAVNEFNRYNTIKLTIADPTVASLPVGGVFRTDNLDDFTRAVHAVLGLQVRNDGRDIVISR